MKDGRGGQAGMDFGEWDKDADLTEWIEPALQNLKAGGNIVIFNDWKNLGEIAVALCDLGCDVKRCLVWRKTNPTPFNRDRLFVNSVEFAIWAVKKGHWTFNRLKSNFETGVFDYPSNSRNEHPTQKSLALAKEIISILTNENDLIYDPFAGSGTFGVAARELNRSYFGVEKNDKYFDLASSKLQLTQKGLEQWLIE
jgi:DNA modification methylase